MLDEAKDRVLGHGWMDGIRGVDGWHSWCGWMACMDQRRCHRLAQSGDGIQHALNDVALEASLTLTTIIHSENR